MKLLWISFVLIKVVNLSEISYYEILGLSKQASAQEIRQAYKKLVVKFHPDKNPNVVEQETFLKITEAYETLKDPDKRHKYDIHDSYPSYTRKYDYHSQSEYNNLYYNGLYHNDPFVDSLSGGTYYDYLQEGFQFINFYSPFCPPCQNLVNPWKKLAELYKGVVKVAAVNCKYYNSFCYNSMRINSYPSLIFYPNGKTGNYVNYRGDRTFEVLERFIISYLRSNTVIPTVTHLRTTEEPTAYILGTYMIEDHALLRIAYKLKGLVTIAIVQDDNLWDKLTKNEYIIVVFKYKDTTVEIENTEEKEILKRIVDTLPKIELIQPEKLKEIRNELRNGSKTAWIIYFSSKGHDRLLSHQMRHVYPDMHFGEINCDKWVELCASLQADSPPAWAALKAGGAYQIMPGFVDIRTYIRTAVSATTLHSLSVSDLLRILDGDVGMWVLLIVPYGLAWDHLIEPFTRASLHYTNSQDINFGMMVCTLPNDKHCRRLAGAQPAVTVRAHAETHAYRGQLAEPQLVEFVELLSTTTDMDLTENQILEIMDPSSRYKSWLVAFLPARCGSLCDQLLHEWRLVFKKLKPLEIVRVGALQCSRQASGLCHNVRSPTARFYPVTSDQHYTVNLQYLSQAPYMLEWALEYIDDSIRSLDWSAFTTHVAADELHPTSLKKPWLVYFHSPKCYHCYEMYADFAITGIILSNAVRLGKVNCVNERNLCRHEHITAYPSLKLYLNRNHNQAFSSIISLPVADYATLLQEIKPLVMSYNENSLAGLDLDVVSEGFHVKHDEF